MQKFVAVAIALSLGTGCTYALSPATVKQADRTVPFAALVNEPAIFAGRVVILGGIIARTTQTKAGTVIDVTQKDLDFWGRPQRTAAPGGGFLIFSSRPLDPVLYTPGRELTLAGTVADPAAPGLPENPLGLPVLLPVEIKLWPTEPRSGDRPSWWDPLHDPEAKRGL